MKLTADELIAVTTAVTMEARFAERMARLNGPMRDNFDQSFRTLMSAQAKLMEAAEIECVPGEFKE